MKANANVQRRADRRRLDCRKAAAGRNTMQGWYREANPFRVILNFLIIYLCRYLPFLPVKNFLYRLLGMQVGKNVSVGLMAMMDVLFPQLISIGDNSVIGYNVTILCHEFRVREFCTGRVEIGPDVLIGANSTILPGVVVGAGAQVGAGSLVNRDIPPGVLAAGVPARVIRKIEDF